MSESKIKIPKSVKNLRISIKKFAKENDIKIKGKSLSKREKKRNIKRLENEYALSSINGLNKALKIIIEHPQHKKVDKIKEGIDNIISNSEVMKKIIKIYRKDPDNFNNMKYLPDMIITSILYYSRDDITEEEKAIAESMNKEELIEFCEKILKKEIKKYIKFGFSPEVAFQLATVIPTAKLFNKGKNRVWFRRLIQLMMEVAEKESIDVDMVFKAVCNIDKKKEISKKEFAHGFYNEFILQRVSNKHSKFNDRQKELHELLIDRALTYLNELRETKLFEVLKNYIKRRKEADKTKNDSKRVIKFTDHANSNSPYLKIKKVVQELIELDKENEIYLS